MDSGFHVNTHASITCSPTSEVRGRVVVTGTLVLTPWICLAEIIQLARAETSPDPVQEAHCPKTQPTCQQLQMLQALAGCITDWDPVPSGCGITVISVWLHLDTSSFPLLLGRNT